MRCKQLHGKGQRFSHTNSEREQQRYLAQRRQFQRGQRIALFFTRSYARVLRPGLSQVTAADLPDNPPLRRAFDHLECAMDQYVAQAKLTSES